DLSPASTPVPAPTSCSSWEASRRRRGLFSTSGRLPARSPSLRAQQPAGSLAVVGGVFVVQLGFRAPTWLHPAGIVLQFLSETSSTLPVCRHRHFTHTIRSRHWCV